MYKCTCIVFIYPSAVAIYNKRVCVLSIDIEVIGLSLSHCSHVQGKPFALSFLMH